MNVIGKHKVCMCSRCGNVQVVESLKRMNCVYCGKTSQFRVRSEWAVKIREFNSAREAAFGCLVWKKELEP